jgi:hypothetical protein
VRSGVMLAAAGGARRWGHGPRRGRKSVGAVVDLAMAARNTSNELLARDIIALEMV